MSAQREAAILGYRQQHRVGAHRVGWGLGEAQLTVSAVLVQVDDKKLGWVPDGGGSRGAARTDKGHSGAGYDYLHVAVDDRSPAAYVEVHPDQHAATAAAS